MKSLFIIIGFFAVILFISPSALAAEPHKEYLCDLEFTSGKTTLSSVAICGKQVAPIGLGLGSALGFFRSLFG